MKLSTDKKTAAVIGLGSMGYGMAASLLRGGFDVAGYDVVASNRDRLVQDGARAAKNPAEAARGAPIVGCVVVNAAQTEQVLYGADGVAEAMPRGGVFIGSATADPAVVRKLADRLIIVDNVVGWPSRARLKLEVERTDLETIIANLVGGHFNDPVRICLRPEGPLVERRLKRARGGNPDALRHRRRAGAGAHPGLRQKPPDRPRSDRSLIWTGCHDAARTVRLVGTSALQSGRRTVTQEARMRSGTGQRAVVVTALD